MATPTESASTASSSGALLPVLAASEAPPIAASRTAASSGSSGRDARDRNASRHRRDTTVVSHAGRFRMPSASARHGRTHYLVLAAAALLTRLATC